MSQRDVIEPEELPGSKSIAKEMLREKTNRRDSPMLLHRWWAVRPGALARVATYLAITDEPTVDQRFLRDLARQEPTAAALAAAHTRIRDAAWRRIIRSGTQAPSGPPVVRVLDPFAGSGAIPREAGRLGCEVYAGDLNPVAFSILQCALVFPHELIEPESGGSSAGGRPWAGLIAEVRQAAASIEKRVLARIGPFFPANGRIPKTYWWCRTIKCPKCGRAAPATARVFLEGASDSKAYGFVIQDGRLVLTGGAGGKVNEDRGRWSCVHCGATSRRGDVRLSPVSESILVAVQHSDRSAAVPTRDGDVPALTPSGGQPLTSEIESLLPLCPRLDQRVHIGGQVQDRTGDLRFRDLFGSRQLLVCLTFVEEVKRELAELKESGLSPRKYEAMARYLAFLASDIADRNSALCDVNGCVGGSASSFRFAAYRQPHTFVEQAPSRLVEGWLGRVTPAIEKAAGLPAAQFVYHGSATSLPFGDDHFDAVVTDPPYYDRIPYGDLADFYDVWESAIVGDAGAPAQPVLALELVTSPADPSSGDAYQKGMLSAFREIHRVLRPEGTLCLLFTGAAVDGFKYYVDLCQQAGLELINIQKLPDVRGAEVQIETATLLIYLRKPGQLPSREPLVVTAPEKLIEAATAGRPVLYGALAKLLDEKLDEETKKELLPEGAKGLPLEQLMEVVAGEDPRDLLNMHFGKDGIRRLARELGLSTDGRTPLEAVLEHFNLGVPPARRGLEGPKQACDRLTRLAASVRQADQRGTITGTFLDACSAIERQIRFGIWSWAEFAFGSARDNELIAILRAKDPNRQYSLDRLTFGHIATLFRDLPDRIAQGPQAATLEAKLGRRHVYKPSGPQKLGNKLNEVVELRNRVEHNKNGYREDTPVSRLSRELAKGIEGGIALLGELVATLAIPRVAVPFEEIRDQWNRLRYRLNFDDGTDSTARFSEPLKLGHQYIYLGTETNPVPVDPLILDAERVGTFQ